MSSKGRSQPLVLTAADHRFARTLMQFLLSAERQGENRRCRWVIGDLGLTEGDRSLLARRFPWAALHPFSFAEYPPHVALAAGSYAWKPVIIRALAQGHDGPLFWFDSGTILRRPLDEVLAALRLQGFWGLRSQMPLARKCDVRVMDALGVPCEVRHLREYAAGAVGFDLANPLGRTLVDDWGRHALIRDHIAPEAYPAFHKHDQALLNCLLAGAAFTGDFEPTADEIDISSASPSRLVSTRNYVAPGLPLVVDPLLRARAAAVKAADRLWHRARRFDDTRLDGLRRRWKEHFSIRLHDSRSGRHVVLKGRRDSYYADPFIWQRDGRFWIFAEEFVYARDQGRLVVLALDENLAVAAAEPLTFVPGFAALDCHASFPFIFAHAGAVYMIPETHERRAVDLFVCEDWPRRWRLVRRLLWDIDAVDTVAVEREGRWYLITSVAGAAANRHLEIHHADNILSGCFSVHPVSNRNVYGNNTNGTGRNAGSIIRQPDSSLLRLMQNNPDHYGQGHQTMRITTLTPTDFTEEFIPPGDVAHHRTQAGPITATDIRDRHR